MDFTASNDEEKLTQDFIAWLHVNGAQYPKIKWPSDDTVCQSR